MIRIGYVEDNVDQLFEHAGNNVHTINVRTLWEDTIVTRDHRVVQHILATGFSDFDKGAELKLLYVQRPLVPNDRITGIRLYFQGSLVCSATGYLIPMVLSGRRTAH